MADPKKPPDATAKMRILKPPAQDKPQATAPRQPAAPSGRVTHDSRGNAVWDWMKGAAQVAIESTSRLLRRLEVPELKVEEKKDEELRLESDRDEGGGYDPYSSAPKKGRR